MSTTTRDRQGSGLQQTTGQSLPLHQTAQPEGGNTQRAASTRTNSSVVDEQVTTIEAPPRLLFGDIEFQKALLECVRGASATEKSPAPKPVPPTAPSALSSLADEAQMKLYESQKAMFLAEMLGEMVTKARGLRDLVWDGADTTQLLGALVR